MTVVVLLQIMIKKLSGEIVKGVEVVERDEEFKVKVDISQSV